MVTIPKDTLDLIIKEQMIIISSVDERGIPNTSPRTAFTLKDGNLYWIELFEHKSMKNFKNDSWISVSAFNKDNLEGYQLKGKIKIVDDITIRKSIAFRIMYNLTGHHRARILSCIGAGVPRIIKFEPKIAYNSAPVDSADVPIVVDADEEISMLSGGPNMETKFGFQIY